MKKYRGVIDYDQNKLLFRLEDYNGNEYTRLKTIKIGGGGDPYLVTLEGKLYKMENFNGYSRMIQGYLGNKLLTINAETKITNNNQAVFTDKYVEDNLIGIKDDLVTEFKNNNYKDKNNAFITKLYIQLDSENILIDLNSLNIIENNSNFKIESNGSDETLIKNNGLLKHYWGIKEETIKIDMSFIKIIVSKSKSPQINGFFSISNGELIENPTGALANTIFRKDMKIKSLKDLNPIKRNYNRKNPKRIIKELYINNLGNKYVKEIEIY